MGPAACRAAPHAAPPRTGVRDLRAGSLRARLERPALPRARRSRASWRRSCRAAAGQLPHLVAAPGVERPICGADDAVNGGGAARDKRDADVLARGAGAAHGMLVRGGGACGLRAAAWVRGRACSARGCLTPTSSPFRRCGTARLGYFCCRCSSACAMRGRLCNRWLAGGENQGVLGDGLRPGCTLATLCALPQRTARRPSPASPRPSASCRWTGPSARVPPRRSTAHKTHCDRGQDNGARSRLRAPTLL